MFYFVTPARMEGICIRGFLFCWHSSPSKRFNVESSHVITFVITISAGIAFSRINVFSLIEKCSPVKGRRQDSIFHFMVDVSRCIKSTFCAKCNSGPDRGLKASQQDKNYDNLNVFHVLVWNFLSFLCFPFLSTGCVQYCLSCLHCYFTIRFSWEDEQKETEKHSSEAQCCFIMALLLFIPHTDAAKEENKALI